MVILGGLVSGVEGVACLRHWLGLSCFCYCFLTVIFDGSAL